MNILVSFNNVTTPGRPSLGLLDGKTFEFRAVQLPAGLRRSNGITGLACDSRYIYTVVQSPPALLALDRADLTLAWQHSFTSALDVHSILVQGARLYAVSTGTDEVLELVINEAGVTSQSVIWRPEPDAARLDFHHLNSICSWRGELLVSGFGKKTGAGWSTALDGFIHNITRDERVISGIRNPHSLVVLEDAIAYCESAHRRVYVVGDERAVHLPGYTRGFCVAGQHLFIGTSLERRVSKSTGQANLDPAPATPEPRCTVSRLSASDFAVEVTIELGSHAMEIYELLPVTGTHSWPMVADTEETATRRQWWQQVEIAMHDIAQVTPAGTTLLLIDGDQWGVGDTIMGRPRVSFPKPANGESAIREIERLRGLPANYLVVAWPSFWWLDYYPELRRYLRERFPCRLENDRVIVFDLQQPAG